MRRLPNQRPPRLHPHLDLNQQIRHTLPFQQHHTPARIVRLAVLQRGLERSAHDADGHGAHERGAGGEGRGDEAHGGVGGWGREDVGVRDAQVAEFDVRARGGGMPGRGEVVQHGVGVGVVVRENVAREEEDHG